MPAKYRLPDCLREQQVDEAAFVRWLHRKAQAHVNRDRERGVQNISVAGFKEAILRAVIEAGGRDYYTGQTLDWHRISKWNNAESSQNSAAYKREFWNLPTVDHDFTDPARTAFRLCSWRLNDPRATRLLTNFSRWLSWFARTGTVPSRHADRSRRQEYAALAGRLENG